MKKLLMEKLAKAKKYINKKNEDEIWLKKTQNGWNLKKKTILKMMSNKISSNEKNKDQIWNIKQITGGEIEKHF